MKVTLVKRGKKVSEFVTRDGVVERQKYNNKYNNNSSLRVTLVQNNSLNTPVMDLVEESTLKAVDNNVETKKPQNKVLSVSLKSEEPVRATIAQKETNKPKVLNVSLKNNDKGLSSVLSTRSSIIEEVDDTMKVNLSSLKYNNNNQEEVFIDRTQGVHINDCEIIEDNNNGEEAVEEVKEEKLETKNSHVQYDGGLAGLGIDINKLKESMLVDKNETDNYDEKYKDITDEDMEKFYNNISENDEDDDFSHDAQHSNRNSKKKIKFKYDESYEEY